MVAVMVLMSLLYKNYKFNQQPNNDLPPIKLQQVNVNIPKIIFPIMCRLSGGKYLSNTFWGIGKVVTYNCVYIKGKKAKDAGRLCSSQDPNEKIENTCNLCEYKSSCSLAAGDFGPLHCKCNTYSPDTKTMVLYDK